MKVGSERDQPVCDAVSRYYAALQGLEAESLIETVFLPLIYLTEGQPQVISNEDALVTWWKRLMSRVRQESGFVRGRILRMTVHHLGNHAAVLRMLSVRLGANDVEISQQRTAFILYDTGAGWRISSVVTDLDAA